MYGRAQKTRGLTLIETTLVVATIALLVGLALPAVRAMVDSFQSEGATRSVIHAALNSARTMAVSRQQYIGVRFQKSCISNDPADPLKGLLDAPQYMIFIAFEQRKEMNNLGDAFCAVEGLEPIKLPDIINVLDLTGITGNGAIDERPELSGATTFSIVFSPSGKLIVRDVQTRNRQGWYRPSNASGSSKPSSDDVFNSDINIITYGRGMFIQDDYPAEYKLDKEPSCTHFVICDRSTLRRVYERKTAWTDYLSRISTQALYVNSYTGDLMAAK